VGGVHDFVGGRAKEVGESVPKVNQMKLLIMVQHSSHAWCSSLADAGGGGGGAPL